MSTWDNNEATWGALTTSFNISKNLSHAGLATLESVWAFLGGLTTVAWACCCLHEDILVYCIHVLQNVIQTYSNMQRDQRAYILQNISTHSMDCTPAHSSAKSLGEKLWGRAGVGLHNHQLLCMAMAIDRNTMKHCLIKGKHRTSPNYVVVWYPCVACAERRLRCSHQCPNLSIWVWLQLMGGTRPTDLL